MSTDVKDDETEGLVCDEELAMLEWEIELECDAELEWEVELECDAALECDVELECGTELTVTSFVTMVVSVSIEVTLTVMTLVS